MLVAWPVYNTASDGELYVRKWKLISYQIGHKESTVHSAWIRLEISNFAPRRRPFAYKRGVGDATTVSGLSCGE